MPFSIDNLDCRATVLIRSATAFVSTERIRSNTASSSVETGEPNSPNLVLIFVIFIVYVIAYKVTKKQANLQGFWWVFINEMSLFDERNVIFHSF